MTKLPPVTAWSYSRYNDYAQCPANDAILPLFATREAAAKAEGVREGLEMAAGIADEVSLNAAKEIASFDSYGGPELSERRVYVQLAASAGALAKAIRKQKDASND